VPPVPPGIRPKPTPQPLVAPPGYDLTGAPPGELQPSRIRGGGHPPSPHNPHG